LNCHFAEPFRRNLARTPALITLKHQPQVANQESTAVRNSFAVKLRGVVVNSANDEMEPRSMGFVCGVRRGGESLGVNVTVNIADHHQVGRQNGCFVFEVYRKAAAVVRFHHSCNLVRNDSFVGLCGLIPGEQHDGFGSLPPGYYAEEANHRLNEPDGNGGAL
jgi:hypothetical protein